MQASASAERPLAVVIGARGGVGGAVADAAEAKGFAVYRFARATSPPLDVRDEESVAGAARLVAETGRAPRMVFIATGLLHDARFAPEKGLRQIDPAHLAEAFAVNSIGPALVLKHFCPLLPKEGRCVVAALSARVGSIGDNRLGGWHAYRASKAALNQIFHTAAIELARARPEAICVVLHPGTVDTRLSAPFMRAGLDVRSPATAAADLLRVIDALGPADSGGFFDHRGKPIPW